MKARRKRSIYIVPMLIILFCLQNGRSLADTDKASHAVGSGTTQPATTSSTGPEAHPRAKRPPRSSELLTSFNLGAGIESGKAGGTVIPDLFTGTLSYSVPISVPAGRHGTDPGLALSYQSDYGNGWVGVGWELEVGSIERSIKSGVSYTAESYVLRTPGSTIDLVNIDNNANIEFRAQIEGAFLNIIKVTAADNRISWQVTDTDGVRYLYGETTASRQDDPANADHIFKWCMDKVIDTNGNFLDISYDKNVPNGTGTYQGQIYLKEIDYTGHMNTSGLVDIQPSNYVHFYLETQARSDAPTMYTTNFGVTTAYRLKLIDIFSNNSRQRVYQIGYQYSATTGRSLLTTE